MRGKSWTECWYPKNCLKRLPFRSSLLSPFEARTCSGRCSCSGAKCSEAQRHHSTFSFQSRWTCHRLSWALAVTYCTLLYVSTCLILKLRRRRHTSSSCIMLHCSRFQAPYSCSKASSSQVTILDRRDLLGKYLVVMTMGLRITNGKSLLAGSLTLSKQVVLTLTYPIQEVLSALSRMMSHHVSSTPGITPDQFTHHTTHHTVTVYTARHHINSIFWASVMDPLRFHTLCAHFLQTSRKKMHLCEIVEARNIKMFINFPNVLMWDSQCNRHGAWTKRSKLRQQTRGCECLEHSNIRFAEALHGFSRDALICTVHVWDLFGQW